MNRLAGRWNRSCSARSSMPQHYSSPFAVLAIATTMSVVGCDSEVKSGFSSDARDGAADGAAGEGTGGRAGTGGAGATGGSAIKLPDASLPSSGGKRPVSEDGGTDDAGDAATVSDASASDAQGDGGADCASRHAFYADQDGDGFGDGAVAYAGCAPPANGRWVEASGDCNDGNADVHPEQKAFFGTPYARTGGDPSYDYDCSGSEEPDTTQPLAPTSCGLLALALCDGSGYVSTARTGAGTNAYCGSLLKTTCRAALGILVCEAVTAPTEVPFACH
jgi:hypothetical protein